MQAKDKFTLGLELPTDPRWIHVAEENIVDILIDHAYCEQKAATSCISLIVLFHDRTELVEILTPIVAEEWDHFQRVLALLRARGHALGRARKDEYVDGLKRCMRKGGSRDQQLMEKLLLNALIEARSCERFKMLSQHIDDEALAAFYHELMIAEAGHFKTFLKLAKTYVAEDVVDTRWRELLEAEATLMASLGVRGDRMH